MMKALLGKLKDAFFSALPIVALVIILSFALTDMDAKFIALFGVASILLIIGMAFFSLGADVAMMPIGNDIGAMLSKKPKNKLWFVILICIIIGFVITIAEPDLIFLSEQLGSKSVIYVVAAGVGFFVVVSVLRTLFKIKLSIVLFISYITAFILAAIISFVRPEFLAVSFDSGGITTGPITVPFLMALGIGVASVRGSKNHDDSFGMVALCTIGPVIAVLILGLTGTVDISAPESVAPVINSAGDIFYSLWLGLVDQAGQVGIALLPIAAVFILFQLTNLKLPKKQVIKILIGIVYTFVGLTVFLAAVNIGFMPIGKLLGFAIAEKSYRFILVPLGFILGALIVLAEPAIHVLNKQVEEITGGAITKRVMLVSMCVGIALAVAMAMLRVLTGISIWFFLAPVYAISLTLIFIAPPMFSNIAFDSGGVASGPMTATFLLPFALGACQAIGGNPLIDAFGMAAFVTMMPILIIQLMGVVFKMKTKHLSRRTVQKVLLDQDWETVDFDKDENIIEKYANINAEATLDTVDFDEEE